MEEDGEEEEEEIKIERERNNYNSIREDYTSSSIRVEREIPEF